MPFANIEQRKQYDGNSKFRKTEYIQLAQGENTIRILEPSATDFYAHYVNRAYVKCLGEDCPICENNKKIIFEDREGFRDNKSYRPRSQRFYVNVLDKSLAKVCPACGTATRNLGLVSCPACASVLANASPLNKVKVLAKGKDLFEPLEMMSKTIRFPDNEVVPITDYDWTLIVSGTDKNTKTNALPRWIPGQESEPDLMGQELFPLDSVLPELTREELVDLLNGASLKDIFAIRRAAKQVATNENSDGDPVLMGDVTASVDGLFGG